jgi:dihydropteroate synthase
MKKLINARGRLLDLSTPVVMAILNITPDSFHAGSRSQDIENSLIKVNEFIMEGATIIDIGAQSTRPGATLLTAEEEWERLKEILPMLTKQFPGVIFSIDTFYSSVAEKAADLGVAMINDVSGGQMDQQMFATVARLKMPYVLMHMKGTPATMQQHPAYEEVTKEVFNFFQDKKSRLIEAGVNDIILDPGFGFGKTTEHNFQLLHNLSIFSLLDCPILVGFSRKSMITKVIQTSSTDAVNGTTVLNTLALSRGASILRVHDVKEAREAIALYDYEIKSGNGA